MDTAYYNAMLEKGRLMPFKKDGRLVCIIAYYIGDRSDLERFVSVDPWTVVEDKNSGSLAYINQLITDKDSRNPKLSYQIWNRFKSYILQEYPSVREICWRRFKNKRIYVFNKVIKEA